MKKILLLLTLVIIISCSLDTFNSENMASWSINLDFPLYKTDFTIDEMLKNYDDLDVEPYGSSGDSIYVFNTSTALDLEIGAYEITKVGGSVVPISVPVADYEIDIPSLPEELDGINLVEVDLTLEFNLAQFDTTLADSVIVDNILITGTNDDGEEKTATISNQDILTGEPLVIEDPEDLINIRPTSVIITGSITIYPSDQPGTYTNDQIIVINTKIHALLILEITESAVIDIAPQKIKLETIDELESVTLFADIENQMEIGGSVQVLVARDTMIFEPGSTQIPDTLAIFQLLPNQEQLEIIELGPEKFDLLADSTYVKILFNIIGNTDAQGNPIPVRFLTGDSTKVLLYGNTQLLIDPQNMDEEE